MLYIVITFAIFLYLLLIRFTFQFKHLIVTGASASHELSIIQFLYYCMNNNNSTIIVWDLGFSKSFIKLISAITKVNKNVIYKKFNYSFYPAFFNINVNKGEYAWKAVIINITYYTFKQNVLWLDSGCIVNGTLHKVFKDINVNNCWSIYSSGKIYKWTHVNMLNYFNASCEMKNRKMCSGGLVGFKWKSDISKSLLNEWVKCSLNKNCIAPNGSNRYNHRQDQSVLSILLYKYNIYQNCPFNYYNILIHKDLHNKRTANFLFNILISFHKNGV